MLISNFSFKEDNILAKNVGIKSKWKFNFDWRISNKWKWNVHSRKCGNEIVKTVEKQPAKKRKNVQTSAIFVFFAIKEPFNKDDVHQKDFL